MTKISLMLVVAVLLLKQRRIYIRKFQAHPVDHNFFKFYGVFGRYRVGASPHGNSGSTPVNLFQKLNTLYSILNFHAPPEYLLRTFCAPKMNLIG